MLKSKYNSKILEAGCDEAGRGCLSGPVYAAAVILPKNYQNETLDDSKKINEKTRYKLRDQIEKDALDFAVGVVDNIEIDKINILNASFLAMHRAIDKLKINPELLLIDGNRFTPYKSIKHKCIIKGDSIYMSIA
ncbi:MAG: ribonuclease HII, partial [Bacteroidales bacterium]|nr:ribonuclease HII [Bacteroidales bacterium]